MHRLTINDISNLVISFTKHNKDKFCSSNNKKFFIDQSIMYDIEDKYEEDIQSLCNEFMVEINKKIVQVEHVSLLKNLDEEFKETLKNVQNDCNDNIELKSRLLESVIDSIEKQISSLQSLLIQTSTRKRKTRTRKRKSTKRRT